MILAECETLEQGQPSPEEYKGGVTVIHRQAEQMSRLIGQLLHITRLEQGTQKTVSLEQADLGELAEVVCEQQRLRPGGHHSHLPYPAADAGAGCAADDAASEQPHLQRLPATACPAATWTWRCAGRAMMRC